MQSSRWDKFRILTIALIFSVALNIALCLAFVLSALGKGEGLLPAAKLAEEGSCISSTNCQILDEMLKLSLPELLVCLTDLDPVEEGYLRRDLALSALVATHHFHLEKALSSAPLQKRVVFLSPQRSVCLYPDLTEEQYEAIIRFGYQETWPLTAKGLFLKLAARPKGLAEKSLAEAFFATSEFHSLQILFQKTNCPQSSDILLNLVLEGPWDTLQDFVDGQAQVLDLSVEKRRSVLLSYLMFRSPAAAKLLLESDFSFASLKLTDEAVLFLLDLLQEQTEDVRRYCVALLRSLRKDAVLLAAHDKLYAIAGEIPPSPFNVNTALARFDSMAAPPAAPEPAPRFLEHTVQEGESLWKISRQYKVKVEDLIQYNGLEQDRLLPGMVLRIP